MYDLRVRECRALKCFELGKRSEGWVHRLKENVLQCR